MKSIVQEGSTISKAVESAWQSAGKPHEFTVKVLEEPVHNFIGMTTRSAKVALFFKEPFTSGKPAGDKSERFRNDRNDRSGDRDNRSARPKKQTRGPRPEQSSTKPYAQPKDARPARPTHQPEEGSWSEEREPRPARTHTRTTYTEGAREHVQTGEPHEGPGFDGVFWTPEMITMAKDWLQGSLSAMELHNLNYSTDVNRLYFKVEFADPVNANVATERQIFRSFAMLLMQHMRNRLKRPLKGFKVVLSRGGVDTEE